jgi:hypothetical protein
MDLCHNVQWIKAFLTAFGGDFSIFTRLSASTHLVQAKKHQSSDSAFIRVGERSEVSNKLREDIERIEMELEKLIIYT